MPVPHRGAEQGTQTPVTSPRVPKLPCCLSTTLRSTVDLCHGTSTCRTCIRCWGMLGLAGRGKWVLGDRCGWHICSGAIYGCRAVPPAHKTCSLPACPMCGDSPDARMGSCTEVLPPQCPGSCPKGVGSWCLELFQTFALGEGPLSHLPKSTAMQSPPALSSSSSSLRSPSQCSPRHLKEPWVHILGSWGHGWGQTRGSALFWL